MVSRVESLKEKIDNFYDRVGKEHSRKFIENLLDKKVVIEAGLPE